MFVEEKPFPPDTHLRHLSRRLKKLENMILGQLMIGERQMTSAALGGGRVIFSGWCKLFQIECKKMHILQF